MDGVEVGPFQVPAGVPQGSPISPILFILYISTLCNRLQKVPGQITIGFADDTNILAFAKTEAECIRTLERAYDVATAWAHQRGMSFAPHKSEVIHFAKGAPTRTTAVRLGDIRVPAQGSGRFLGVWLDSRLRFNAHVKAFRGKMETQMNALTRLAASAWGCTTQRAREIYTKVIRNAMAYGAGAFHYPNKPRVAKALATTQNKALPKVLGAYKTTPIRHLKAKACCPPLDLYMNKRLAEFERRTRDTGMGAKLETAMAKVAARLRGKRGRRRGGRPQGHYGIWAEKWVKERDHLQHRCRNQTSFGTSVINARERRATGGKEAV